MDVDRDDPRSIRVFVSSTFRDMQLERDELVKRVFPRIRKLCEQRGVAWSEVDLRWGVTDEQKAEGAVLPICLAEIERTRPYFIGLLGQRYGWVPDEIPDELAERIGWLTDDRGRSVTEMEIVHGVLDAPGGDVQAFFYLRDAAWVDALPDAERATYVEESEHGRQRLSELRERVRASGHPVRDFPDPVALGDLVLADLTALVDARYPPDTTPDDRETAAQRAHLRRLVVDAVERPSVFQALDRYVDDDGPPLLVTGEPGVGASTVVAAWLRHRMEQGDAVWSHHVAADADATDPRATVARLVAGLTGSGRAEVGQTTDVTDVTDVTDDPVAQRAALRRAFAAVERPTLVVIDGLERLDDVGGAPDLRWLPSDVPKLVRIVVVSSGERPRRQVEHRGWPVLEVPPLEPAERRELAVRVLARYSKALDSVHLDALVSAARAGNARFLRIVLDELRQHGDHFTLGPTIAHLCGAPDVDALYDLVLDRYERDFDRDRPGLTRDVMTALWAARRGLAEAELLDLLGATDATGDHVPLPQAMWAPLHLAAEQALTDRAGLLGLADPPFRRAVADRYLPGESERRAAHGRLAALFTERRIHDGLGERVVDELTWQQVRAGDLDGLTAALADLDHVDATHRRGAADLRRAWAWAAEHGVDMVATYRALVDRPGAHDRDTVWAVARLLTDAGHPAEALRLHHHLVDDARRAPAGRDDASGDARLRAALVNLAGAAWTQGRLTEAAEAADEAAHRCRRAGDDEMLSSAVSVLALARRDLGELNAADELFAEEAELCRRLDDEFGLQVSLGNRAQLLRQLGRFDDTLAVLEEQERLCRTLADDAGVARALAGRAVVLAQCGDVAAAITTTERHVAHCREQGDRRGLVEALVNLATMRVQLGDLSGALAATDEGEAVARRLADPALVARILAARADALTLTGQWAEVERVAREAELTARQAGLTHLVTVALGIVGTARRELGDVAGAKHAHTEELQLATSIDDPTAIAVARANLANVAVVEQRFDEALAHWSHAEPTLRDAQVLSSLVPLLANRGQVHHGLGRHGDALVDFHDATTFAAQLGHHTATVQWGEVGVQLATHLGDVDRADAMWVAITVAARATGDQARLQRALGDRAVLLIGKAQPGDCPGDATNVDRALLAEASALLDEQEAICRAIGHGSGLADCIGNQAIVRRYVGDLEGALAALDEQLRLAHEAGHAQGVLFATANRGEVLGLLGRVSEAVEALGWARQVAAHNGIAAMVQQLDAMIAALQTRN